MKYLIGIFVILIIVVLVYGNKGDKVHNDFDLGYKYASENDIDNFKKCQEIFGTGDAEDGCNEYVKEYYTGHKTFYGYECTEDCSGHEAGYSWAEKNNVKNKRECESHSTSFTKGCLIYLEQNY